MSSRGRRFPATGLCVRRERVGGCLSFNGHFLSPRAKPNVATIRNFGSPCLWGAASKCRERLAVAARAHRTGSGLRGGSFHSESIATTPPAASASAAASMDVQVSERERVGLPCDSWWHQHGRAVPRSTQTGRVSTPADPNHRRGCRVSC
jgi:hypothetical protein